MKNEQIILSALSKLRIGDSQLISLLHILNKSTEIFPNKLVDIACLIRNIQKDELERMPMHINVISISAVGRLKETAHSAILQTLLCKQEILDSFIEEIAGISNFKVSVSSVRKAETDRIDVSIYSRDLCIIIENKVNGAYEQEGQLYRYVECARASGYTPKQIKVVYLNPDHHSIPSDYSLTEKGEGKIGLPEEVMENMVVKSYSYDIYNWIKKLPLKLSDNEPYLHSALLQYQDYLEEFFHLTDKYKSMKDRIRTTITEEILTGLDDNNDNDFSARLAKLNDIEEDLNMLLSGIGSLKHELMIAQEKQRVEAELQDSTLKLVDMQPYGYSEDNYGIRITLNGQPGFIAYGNGKNPYIGFGFDLSLLSQSAIRNLLNLMKAFNKDPEEEPPFWAAWAYIGNSPLWVEFSRFIDFVENYTYEENFRIEIQRF